MDANSPTDKDVWVRVLAGDGRAFGTLFDRHRDRVFRHAVGRLTNATDAEDATAIAFLELWRARARVRFVDDSLLPWLIVTTSNVTHNLRRSRRRYERMLASLPAPEEQADHSDHANRRIDNAANHAALAKAIAELPPVDRQLISLTALEGFTLQQASEALGLSYGATKTRSSRVRSRLHNALTSHGIRTEGTTP